MKLISKLIAAVALTVVALTSQSTIITGHEVNVTHVTRYSPDISSPEADLGNQIVPTGSFYFDQVYEVTVSDTYMTLNAFCGSDCFFDEAIFNGPVLSVLSKQINAPFTGVSIDEEFSEYAGFDASRLSFDSEHVYLNLQGLAADGFLQVNFNGNTVPEPESLALVGLALAGLVLTRRKAKQAQDV